MNVLPIAPAGADQSVATPVTPADRDKELHLREKEHEIALKEIEVEERRRQLDHVLEQRWADESARCTMDKINTLAFLLQSTQIDEHRSVFGSEPMQRPLFNEPEMEEIRERIMRLVRQL